MKKSIIQILLFSFLLISGEAHLYAKGCNSKSYTKFVDPFIGTAGHGHTFPGACLPFAMVQLSPDNGKNDWDWCSGYHASDSIIIGFSHTHLSGTGCSDLRDILIMPTLLNPKSDSTKHGGAFIYNYKSTFSHVNEKASPGYYAVKLDNNIDVELTATLRSGFHKYTFPKNTEPKIIIDLDAKSGSSNNESYIRIVNDSIVEGYVFTKGWTANRKVFFVSKFSKKFSKYYTSKNGILDERKSENRGKSAKAILCFDNSEDGIILAKVGISSSSIEGATKNLATEILDWNFAEIRLEATKAWEKELQKFTVKTKQKDKLKQFYTAVYHNSIAPNLYSDVDGCYTGIDGEKHCYQGQDNYYTFSLWDTFRATHPLFTITDENRVTAFINAMLLQYTESGLLPVWSLWGNETNCMIGYHSVPVIVDAYLKGIKGVDYKLAYEAIKKSAMQEIRQCDLYRKYDYIPSDLHKLQTYGWDQSVSTTLEYAYDDWCIALMAKKIGNQADYSYFIKRSQNFNNIADTTIGFMRRKNSDGKWDSPFNPFKLGNGFTEANAWQYSWFVPHDIPSLINIMGGKQKFEQKLDSLFFILKQTSNSEIQDVSGFIGQYAHGNEPSHHVGYLYNFIGKAWKTQAIISLIRDSLYTSKRDGLCGNDDCGQLSAWYIFSSLGFYPVNPANGQYSIGTPMFEKVILNVGNKKKFTIIAKNVSKKNKYIKFVKLNGKMLNSGYLTHFDIKNGGEIEFIMSQSPNKNLWNQIKDDKQIERQFTHHKVNSVDLVISNKLNKTRLLSTIIEQLEL
ncbi:MAG: GH92 family glycosyl hydrolase [Bacteroidales bacterium]|nr:GH92 family glycosyl hydrolase [Bacteroidales bacterium]